MDLIPKEIKPGPERPRGTLSGTPGCEGSMLFMHACGDCSQHLTTPRSLSMICWSNLQPFPTVEIVALN